jgi:hypothetical protein
MSMAQAWHKQREELITGQGTAVCWRATEYRLDDPGNPAMIEAAPGAKWERFSPFDLYRLTSRTREVEAGPHLDFLNLSSLERSESEVFHTALRVFAWKYGLLGIFEDDYLERPIRPRSKPLIAPDAIIDGGGRLRRVDPATEGTDLLLDLLETRFERGEAYVNKRSYLTKSGGAGWHNSIALPSEVKFTRRVSDLDSSMHTVDQPTALEPWEVIKRDFGAYMILDKESLLGVSVLCTREPLPRWRVSLHNFPSGDESVETLAATDSYSANPYLLNMYLREVSPLAVIGEGGNLDRSWYCRSLLQAMYVMFYLDLTSDNTIRKCMSRGCPNYFRVGSQSDSKYCSKRCAYRAATRMGRGQEP